MNQVKPILSNAGDIWICGNCRKAYVGYWDWEEGKIEFDDFCSRCGAPVLKELVMDTCSAVGTISCCDCHCCRNINTEENDYEKK